MCRRALLALLLSLTVAQSAPASESNSSEAVGDWLWSETPGARPGAADLARSESIPRRFRAFEVRLSDLRERLGRAPLQVLASRAQTFAPGVEITLPLPDGRLQVLRAVETQVLSPELRRSHPDIRTFAAGSNDLGVQAKIELTSLGVRAILVTRDGVAFLDPLERGRTDRVMTYWTKDAPDGSFECEVLGRGFAPAPAPAGAAPRAIGDPLRTFRYALIGTGEFTAWVGGQTQGYAEMVTIVDRINAIFERDLGVHLEITGLMPFPDKATDPFDDGVSAYSLLDRAIAVADSIFGPSAYDVTQTITTSIGYNGIAYAPAVCDSGYKGSAVSTPDPTATWRHLKVMCHELGHNCGAFHTMAGPGCGGPSETSYEPGSGSTIMSYAGKCGPYNVLDYAEPYFHIGSVEQMADTVRDRPSCGTSAATGNRLPSADAGPDYTIPLRTPFVLVGNASDADPGDPLSYDWEEYDPSTSTDTLLGPLFRTLLPSASRIRYLPNWDAVLADTVARWERLPQVNRTLRFRFSVRDGHPGGGGVAWDEMVVTATGPPFVLTVPGAGSSFASGEPIPVTWFVGGGAVASAVNILLSTDGGTSWTPLAANTPNDGSETVYYYTTQTSTTCRIKIEAVGNIFYDLSRPFTIVGGTTDAEPALPTAFAVWTERANPSSGGADLVFALPREAVVDLAVYTARGERVRTLASGKWSAGRHPVTWNGTDASGGRRSAGVYFVQLVAGGERAECRIVLAP